MSGRASRPDLEIWDTTTHVEMSPPHNKQMSHYAHLVPVHKCVPFLQQSEVQ